MDTWTLDGGGRAVVLTPAWLEPSQKLPMLFALHGRGEANKGPVDGVMGWPRDYALVRAIERVCAPPLTSDDLEGFVDPKRLADHNAALAKDAWQGLVVVCPYSPDVDLRKPAQIKDYADYVIRVILPRAKKELPVIGTPASIGIDGVSLGGALALRIGLNNADAFGALGTLQPAIGEDQVAEYTDLAKAGRAKNADLSLRLLTSTKDYFKTAIRATSESWKSAGIAHEFVEVPGPHDYPFNRGPGAIEMLLWHDRLLART
jgi:enterochelin esterase-like enzyme